MTGRVPQGLCSSLEIALCHGRARSRRLCLCLHASQSTWQQPPQLVKESGLGVFLVTCWEQLHSSPTCLWTISLQFSYARIQCSMTEANTLRCGTVSSGAALKMELLLSISSAQRISSLTSSPSPSAVCGSWSCVQDRHRQTKVSSRD